VAVKFLAIEVSSAVVVANYTQVSRNYSIRSIICTRWASALKWFKPLMEKPPRDYLSSCFPLLVANGSYKAIYITTLIVHICAKLAIW